MRLLHRKVFAALTLAGCMLCSMTAYGAQGHVVEPLPDAVAHMGGADAAVGTDVTVSVESDKKTAKDDSVQAAASKADTSAYTYDEDSYVNAGPGAVKQEADTDRGRSLGMFTITGYCGCEACSGGHNLTYSGTVPQPDHTISADLNVFPLGTKLMIDGTVYTVEDMGSSVTGNKLDIFYATHDEALAAGTYTAEVFSAD